MNLWKETIEILENNGKTFDDVSTICGNEFQITKDDLRNTQIQNMMQDMVLQRLRKIYL